MAHETGKGDAPRKARDDKAYSEGWDRIFGAKRGKTKGNSEGEGSQAKEPFGRASENQKSGQT